MYFEKTWYEHRARIAQSALGLGYGVDDQSSIPSRGNDGTFLFTSRSRLALEPTQPPIQSVLRALFLVVKWPGHEADHSHPSSAEVKNAWSYTSTTPVHHGMVLN
jgi:hypothetical protein